jgi:hypothetical protein
VPDERLDRRPVHESSVVATTTQKAATPPAGPGVDTRDDPSRTLLPEDDVVGDHEPPGVDADQAPAENVLPEQDLTLTPFEMREVEILSRQLHAPRLHRGDAVARYEQLPPRNASDQPGDGRVAAFGETRDDVIHPAEPPPCTIDEGAMQDLAQCQPDRIGGWLPGV